MPTPLERIELLLSLILHATANSFTTNPQEFDGNALPDRFTMWQSSHDVVTEQEEEAILANMHLHMTIQNTARGA